MTYPPSLLRCELQNFGGTSRRDVGLLLYIMHQDVSQLVLQKNILQTQQQLLSLEIMTQLLKIIHRPCCELFDVGTVFLMHHHAERKCAITHGIEAKPPGGEPGFEANFCRGQTVQSHHVMHPSQSDTYTVNEAAVKWWIIISEHQNPHEMSHSVQ